MKVFAVLVAVVCMAIATGAANVLIASGVSCADKKAIVDTHNTLRKWIANGTIITSQPKASNMQYLVWDDGLEQLAQKWTNQMVLAHNPDRCDRRWPAVGENLVYTNDPKFNFSSAVMLWFSEYKTFTYGPLKNLKEGHYTQVVWAGTMYVGCGASTFTTDSGRTITLYVCNYGPSGNYLQETPYAVGPGCDNLCCKKQCTKLYGSCTDSLDSLPLKNI